MLLAVGFWPRSQSRSTGPPQILQKGQDVAADVGIVKLALVERKRKEKPLLGSENRKGLDDAD